MPSKSTTGTEDMPNDMPNNISDLAELARKVDATQLPHGNEGIEILPVSRDCFQARWSLSQEALSEGRRIASDNPEDTQLVLRAFSLPPDAHQDELSSVWHDFQIDGIDNSGYFNLPVPSDKINASLGLINQDGRFSPLLRAESVALPAAPPSKPKTPPAVPEAEPAAADQDDRVEEALQTASTFPKRSTIAQILDETEICTRLENIAGLPEAFKAPAKAYLAELEALQSEAPEAATTEAIRTAFQSLPHTPSLDEGAVLELVRHNMAAQPNPVIEESVEQPAIHPTNAAEEAGTPCGASEQLASQWEDIWSDKAPVEIRADFILTGKIASGMKLLLGNQIIAPAPGGFFTWKRELESFDQAWSLIVAALSTPVVQAGPALEFFKDVTPAERLLELHAALEIEGQVTDPEYIERLPQALCPDSNGRFKLSRMLPHGAVIIPGLSLIAG